MAKVRFSPRVSVVAAVVAAAAAASAIVVSAQSREDHGSIGFECDGALVEGGQITCTITRLELTGVPTTTPAPTPTTASPTTTTRGPTTTAGTTTTTMAPAPPRPGCWPDAVPLGALPGQPPPVFCTELHDAEPTFVEGENSWVDDFQHGHSFANIGEGYRAFDLVGSRINQVANWRHADHWMVDINGRNRSGDLPNYGGAWLRPDRSFRFENGRFVVEMDVAAGINAYGGNAWPEIVVTTGDRPTQPPQDSLYAYGFFRGHDTLGIRLAQEYPISAYWRANGTRAYEPPLNCPEGCAVDGSQWTAQARAAWRNCADVDPDTNCRDRFRWEITRTTLTLYVNGVKFQAITNLPPLSDAMMNGEVYVYAGSWIYKPTQDTVRFHWDRFAVNP